MFDVNFFNPKPSEVTEIITYEEGDNNYEASAYSASIKVYYSTSRPTTEEAQNDWLELGGAGDNMTYLGNETITSRIGVHDLIKSACGGVDNDGSQYSITEINNELCVGNADMKATFKEVVEDANKVLRMYNGNINVLRTIPVEYNDNREIQGGCEAILRQQDKNWNEAAYVPGNADQDHYAYPAYYMGRFDFNISTPEEQGYVIIVLEYMCDGEFDNPEDVVINERVETIIHHSTASILQPMVSKWYFILRNLAILVLMLVLIYSGIRIVIGSTAGEKAKYKERLIDWLVAMCLVFSLHYIMVFSVSLVEKITDLVDEATNIVGNFAAIRLSEEHLDTLDGADLDAAARRLSPDLTGDKLLIDDPSAESGKSLLWPTDLMGMFRIRAQVENEGNEGWIGFALCFVVLVLFTIFFTFTYIKRVIYMAFLTMIAPLVAMTYPIDKITDGKAQAFNMWLKEYIFNLMIQPLHLLLYTMLVTAAFELASENPIYALVALGFMMPAEKLMRKFFGFEKAKTPGLLGGAAGAAIAMTGLQSFMKPKHHNGGREDKNQDQNKVKYANKNSINTKESVAGGKPSGGSNNKDNQSQVSNVGNRGNNRTRLSQAQDEEKNTRGLNSQQFENQDNNSNYVDSYEGSEYDFGETSPYYDLGYGDDESQQSTYATGEDPQYDLGFGEGYGNVDEDGNFLEQALTDDENPMSNSLFNETNDVINGNDTNADTDTDPTPISTFAQTKAARSAYENNTNNNKTNLRSFDEEKRANIAKNRNRRRLAIKAVGKTVGKQVAQKAVENIHPIRFTGKLFSAATLGTAGLLLGVASGDPNKAFQYTTAGAVGGAKLADSISNKKILDKNEINQEAEMAYYGEDYKEHVIEKQKEEFEKNKNNISYIRQTMGVSEKEAKDILKTTGGKCFDNGITNVEDIATIHKLTNGEDPLSFNKAVAARNYAKKRLPSDPDQMTQKSIKQYKERWEQEYAEAGYKNAHDLAEQSFKLAIRFNSAQSSLTKNP